MHPNALFTPIWPEKGFWPLHYAAHKGSEPQILQFMVDKDPPSAHIKFRGKYTPLHCILKMIRHVPRGNLKSLRLGDPDHNGRRPFFSLVESVKVLLQGCIRASEKEAASNVILSLRYALKDTLPHSLFRAARDIISNKLMELLPLARTLKLDLRKRHGWDPLGTLDVSTNLIELELDYFHKKYNDELCEILKTNTKLRTLHVEVFDYGLCIAEFAALEGVFRNHNMTLTNLEISGCHGDGGEHIKNIKYFVALNEFGRKLANGPEYTMDDLVGLLCNAANSRERIQSLNDDHKGIPLGIIYCLLHTHLIAQWSRQDLGNLA